MKYTENYSLIQAAYLLSIQVILLFNLLCHSQQEVQKRHKSSLFSCCYWQDSLKEA